MPTNAKKSAYKEREFSMYVLWKSLPAHLKGARAKDLASSGITDPLLARLMKIRTQREFAHRFNIKDLGTLTDWNKKVREGHTPSPLVVTTLNKHIEHVGERVVLPNVAALEHTISEQRTMLAALKKENDSLKRRLSAAMRSKRRSLSAPTATPVPECVASPTPSGAEVKSTAPTTPKTFLQKVRDALLK